MEQTNKIYHTCKCLNRDFTLDEYSDFCKSSQSDNAVFEEYGFKWNIHDICLNPNTHKIIDDKGSYFDITTAKTRNGWVYGYNYSGLDSEWGGGGSGCYYGDNKKFNEEKDAIIAILESFKNKELKPKYIKAIKDEIFRRKCTQLTLF